MVTRKVVRTAFEKCLKAVDPRIAVRDAISLTPTSLKIWNQDYPLSNSTKIIVISYGKASIQMATGAHDILNPHLKKTLILAPEQQKTSVGELGNTTKIWFGAKNNLPDENSVQATRNLIQEIRESDSESTLFLFLISGGGSALLTAPRDTVTLEEKLKTIKIMQAHGATIQELNTVRQKLSEVKGGKLLRNIKKGSSISLIISDIIGNNIDLIASGATVPQKDNSATISEILKDLKIQENDLPESVQKLLKEKEGEWGQSTLY
ncbi:hypothetical protein GCK72_011008 [Caenorhabditis remanei]|uniref:MOFRL-associated domain-containing protein n=1 Tax=Caenorhabditis remanei TaxID=31234 RepID=A0A6A5H7A7_CAERE|nr:hypothetical protein GCK72_011008 [Caenorhabditis remanei]KAF1762746.1 hypothetical protein GCK72_011008 [Caenorhabditis remanei]